MPVSDGTPAGTTMVADINSGSGDVSKISVGSVLIAPLTIGPDMRLYFMADDGAHGVELWRSDGTNDGTTMVADINPGPASANLGTPYLASGRLYFAADNGSHGAELWVLPLMR